MSDFDRIRPLVEAAIRNGTDITADEARILLAEVDRLAEQVAEARRGGQS